MLYATLKNVWINNDKHNQSHCVVRKDTVNSNQMIWKIKFKKEMKENR